MCTTRSAQSYSGTHRPDRDQDHPHHIQSHSAPYPFYPAVAYPHYSPYDPYTAYHHSGPFYPHPPPPPPPSYYAHDIAKEEPTNWSWSTFIFIFLLFASLLGVIYHTLPYEIRRKIGAWFYAPVFAPGEVNHKIK
jgi:hypothetical protein